MGVWAFWSRRWTWMVMSVLISMCCFNFYVIFRILSQRWTAESLVPLIGQHITPTVRYRDITKDGKVNFLPETSVCSYGTMIYIDKKRVQLNLPPFDVVISRMKCLLNGIAAIFGEEFAVFSSAVLDPSKVNNGSISVKGGEKIEDVWDQPEDIEYISPLPGYFAVPCQFPPVLNFDETDYKYVWGKGLRCHDMGPFDVNNSTNSENRTTAAFIDRIQGLTIAVTRYEYANFYHAMTDFYNAFVLKLLLSTRGEGVNILFVDVHPETSLDTVWANLFQKVIRAGKLQKPTTFEKLVWGIQGYRSPLNQHHSVTVPYLEEFRHFFTSRHGVNDNATLSDHVIDCRRINALIIWRHDHVSHPRNRQGKVVRKFSNEEEILKTVRNIIDTMSPPGLGKNTVVGVALETLDMKEQLSLISECDILIGMHGAGLSHALFLPQTSGLVEMLPSYSSPDLIHFQAMARWRGIAYERWHNVEWKMDKDGAETYVRPSVVRKVVKSIHRRICPGA